MIHKTETLKLLLRSTFALLLATNVWVWLRLSLAFWYINALATVPYLTTSLTPVTMAIETFLILVFPVLTMTYVVMKFFSPQWFLILAALGGVFLSFLNFQLFPTRAPISTYLLSGLVSGIVFALVYNLTAAKKKTGSAKPTPTMVRRKFLSGLGLLAGATATLASFAGPFYMWRKRNEFIDIDIHELNEGQMTTTEVGGKPIWVLKRSPWMVSQLRSKTNHLRDPNSELSSQPMLAKNNLRSIREEYFVAVGICTHLGCMPVYDATGEYGTQNNGAQFYCPCHGATFDLAGRVTRTSVDATNLLVPNHDFVSDTTVRVFHHANEVWH